MITRQEALDRADAELQDIIRSGDPEIFAAAGGDPLRLVNAAMRAREKLADQIMEVNIMTEPTMQRRISEDDMVLFRQDPGALKEFAATHGIFGDVRVGYDPHGPFISGISRDGADRHLAGQVPRESFATGVSETVAPEPIEAEAANEPDAPDFAAMAKEQIEKYVIVHFGVNLNTRMTKAAMIAEAERLAKEEQS